MVMPKIPMPSWARAQSRKIPLIQSATEGLPAKTRSRSPGVLAYGVPKNDRMKKTEVGTKSAELRRSSSQAYFSRTL
jgi:hypothetical protein